MNWFTEGWSWRRGLIFFVAACLVGALLAFVGTKAEGYPAPVCNGCTSHVRNAHDGVRKFKHHRLGRAPKHIHYPAKAKRIILNKLMAKQRQLASRRTLATQGGFARVITRQEMWQNFTIHDNCFWQASSGSPSTASWTCKPGRIPYEWNDSGDWNGKDVHAVLCGSVAGIGIGGAMAAGGTSGPAAPWVWSGIGAGWVVCQFGAAMERAADN